MRDIIQTDRLTLRPLQMSDAEKFSLYGSDFDIARMTGSFPHPFPLLSAEFKVMDLNQKRYRTLAFPYAVTTKDGAFMGVADLFRSKLSEPLQTDLEIGYWIARPFWGKGFATEACQGLISEARDTLGATRMKAGVFADNPGSQKVLKKLGFTQNGPATNLFFSMARLKKALSIDMTLDINNFNAQSFAPNAAKTSLV